MKIQLRHDQLTGDVVSSLRKVLEPSDEGQCGVGFEYQSPTGVCQLEVAREWRIVPTRLLLDQLDNLVGLPSIRLIY